MGIRFGFVSTYPPTPCGLATFTAALFGALTASGVDEGRVARLLDTPLPRAGSEVVWDIVAGDVAGPTGAAARLSSCDVVIVQHEFGVYGGRDGEDVLAVLAAVARPTIVVLHTVPAIPTEHQRQVLEAVVAGANAAVTMTRAARDRLLAGFRVDAGTVSIIAHGAPDQASAPTSSAAVFRRTRPMVLTWGLLGPGKGIEWAIQAMARLRDIRPSPRYLVAGQTHPKVAARDGEAYRNSLAGLVRRLSLGDTVSMDSRYRDAVSLAGLVASADVVLLPYDSTEQVTSGVLIEAAAAGKPVVATRFPHAVELLSGGAGVTVAHRDPDAIADALRLLITRPDVAAAMSTAAASVAPTLRWSAVAEAYRRLGARVMADAAAPAA
jgi:glycosyltransferase involved in cell wall biosynthesis